MGRTCCLAVSWVKVQTAGSGHFRKSSFAERKQLNNSKKVFFFFTKENKKKKKAWFLTLTRCSGSAGGDAAGGDRGQGGAGAAAHHGGRGSSCNQGNGYLGSDKTCPPPDPPDPLHGSYKVIYINEIKLL